MLRFIDRLMTEEFIERKHSRKILYYLKENSPSRVSDMYIALELHPTSVHSPLAELVDIGFVGQRSDKQYEITEGGLKLIDSLYISTAPEAPHPTIRKKTRLRKKPEPKIEAKPKPKEKKTSEFLEKLIAINKKEKTDLKTLVREELNRSKIALTIEEIPDIDKIRDHYTTTITIRKCVRKMSRDLNSDIHSRIFYLSPEPYRVREVVAEVFYLGDNQLGRFRETIKPEYRDVVKERPVLKSL